MRLCPLLTGWQVCGKKLILAQKQISLSDITSNFKKYFLPAVLVATVIISLLRPTADSLSQVTAKIHAKLNHVETLFAAAAKDTSLRSTLLNGKEDALKIEALENQGVFLYLYKKDSLVHWTSNSVLPLTSPAALETGASLLKLKNGWYQAMKSHDSTTKETLVGLIAVKYQYPFENKFLKNEFALDLNVPHNIEISEQKIPGSMPVKNLRGETMFSLYQSSEEKGEDLNVILLITQIVLLLIVFYYIHVFSVSTAKKVGVIQGFFLLAGSLFLVRFIMLWFDQPSEFNRLDLFNPKYYASSVFAKSLGDLILNTVLMAWAILFWSHFESRREKNARYVKFIPWVYITAVFVYTGLIVWVFKTLVMDSVISFEVYNILSLNYYSLLGMICIAMLIIPHFLIARNAVLSVREAKIKTVYIILFSIFCSAVFASFAIDSPFYHVILFTAAWLVFFIIVLRMLVRNDDNLPVRDLLIYISVYCLLSTFLIENLYERKERNQRKFFASRLVTERDFIAEYMFDDVGMRIGNDPFIRNFFDNPVISKKEINARLSSLYFSGYFNKYELKVYAYDKHGYGLKNRDTVSLKHFYGLVRQDTVQMQKLYYTIDTTENYSYYAFIQFEEDSEYAGELVLHLMPKVYYGQNVYPELLLGENVSTLADESKYNYAIYRHDKLVIQHGDFPYTYYWSRDLQFGNDQYAFIDAGDWEHIVYRFNNDMKVIVTEKHEGLFEPVATFSYFFSFYFIAVVIALLMSEFTKYRFTGSDLFSSFSFSFRTRINYSMLIMIIISFVIIGFITIGFFRKQYDNFYSDRLQRKEKVLHASLEYFIQQNAGRDETLLSERLSNALNFEVARLAEINDIDINIYDEDGTLEVASQPAIYDKGLISKKMNPDAYFELSSTKGAQVTEQENVGELKYLATYAPIRNSKGDAIAYLGIPYFERSKNINDEVSSFLVALMNVYVFLLICAAIVAYFISNSITKPLTIISEKLRILNLNKKNEPIEWKSKDEIGVLIGEYNKMIKELEQSAGKLARSERESAWREMAKQIAHEIKNPLTPMKLSIQYLQRAIDAGDPNISELAKKVARTLEEQIENLSSIATAFASFAKMPKAHNEIINLNELLKSITELFNREDNATVTFSTENDAPVVFADKNQLVSVFNNLVKNAIQSIPEHRKGFIDVHLKEEEGWIIASVNDNGKGIPSDNYEKVFVPNFTTKSSGTGLGLAISKQIIEGTGGKIWFESAENVGTSFFVKLKRSENV